jgi:hypothetical protein
MKKLVCALGVVGMGVAVFGTSANAGPVVGPAARPVAPTAKSVEPSPTTPGTIGYGVLGGAMTYRVLAIASWFKCDNALFGDPAPNQHKACYANGVKLAEEGQMMTTPGPECTRVNVKYVGVNGATAERNFCPGRIVRCSNEVFGSDPAVGIVKHCVLATKTVAQEGGTFGTPYQRECLCGGKSLNELNYPTNILEDKVHE